jgi:hypothetical protein
MAKEAKTPFLICGNAYDGTLFTFEAFLNNNPDNEIIRKFERKLQEVLGSVYIRRDSKTKLRIIMPHESLHTGLSWVEK